MLSERFPPRLRLPLCLQEDQRRPNPGIRGWMHAEGRAQLCAVGAQCCRGRLPEQQIPAELDVLVWFFFSPSSSGSYCKAQSHGGKWDNSRELGSEHRTHPGAPWASSPPWSITQSQLWDVTACNARNEEQSQPNPQRILNLEGGWRQPGTTCGYSKARHSSEEHKFLPFYISLLSRRSLTDPTIPIGPSLEIPWVYTQLCC